MGFNATLGGVLWGVAILGVVAAGACYWVVPWERFLTPETAPDGVDVVRLTRAGMTAAAASLVPFAAGAWLEYVDVVSGLTARAGAADGRGPDPMRLEPVAAVVPTEFVIFVSLLGGMAAAFLPVWVGLWVRARRAVGGDAGPRDG